MKVNIKKFAADISDQLKDMQSKSGKFNNPDKFNFDQATEFFHLMEQGSEGTGLTRVWYKAFYAMYGIKCLADLLRILVILSEKFPKIKSDYDDSTIKDLLIQKDTHDLQYIISVYNDLIS